MTFSIPVWIGNAASRLSREEDITISSRNWGKYHLGPILTRSCSTNTPLTPLVADGDGREKEGRSVGPTAKRRPNEISPLLHGRKKIFSSSDSPCSNILKGIISGLISRMRKASKGNMCCYPAFFLRRALRATGFANDAGFHPPIALSLPLRSGLFLH